VRGSSYRDHRAGESHPVLDGILDFSTGNVLV
jgi:hypothetical protein